MGKILFLAQIFLNLIIVVNRVMSHGRLIDPPSRGSMWRVGYDVPADYNDMSGYCGGIRHLWEVRINNKLEINFNKNTLY